MKQFFCLTFCLTVCLAETSYGHFSGKGHVHTLSETKQVFLNPHCRSTATCDLIRFTLATSVYEVWFSDDPNHPTYGNSVIMEYETDSVDTLENYTIVQFKKGCVFYSAKDSEGKISNNAIDRVPSFGENVTFCFPGWVIDSQDTDPAYNSDPEYGRFYFLRWNEPGSYDHRTHKFYGAEKPKIPVLYMADHPAGAFVTGTGVKNVALEFNTCIYRASEVPAETRREEIYFARAITCFEWQNVYVYDFAKGSFRTDLASVPRWGEPYVGVNVYLVVIFIALLIALAILALLCVGKVMRQKNSPLIAGI